MKLGTLIRVFVFAAIMPVACSAQATEVRTAVAANFTAVMKSIADDFERDTGHTVVLSFGSTGQLYAQIRNGAPFDLFLAADSRRPRLLENEGTAVAGSRFTYAIGKLVLWSPRADLVGGKGEVLRGNAFTRLAIANPTTAPYGAAAREVLKRLGLWKALQGRLARGQSITQAQQFVLSGNAELGFLALSQVVNVSGGSRWLPPQALYTPLRQDAVLLSRGKDNEAARALHAYLQSEGTRSMIRAFGYETE